MRLFLYIRPDVSFFGPFKGLFYEEFTFFVRFFCAPPGRIQHRVFSSFSQGEATFFFALFMRHGGVSLSLVTFLLLKTSAVDFSAAFCLRFARIFGNF